HGTLASSDCVIRLWSVKGGQELLTFSEHEAPVRGVAFLPDGHGVVSCSSDGAILVWDIRRRPFPRALTRQLRPAECLAVSPDGRHVVVGGPDQLRLWDLRAAEELERFPADDLPIHAGSARVPLLLG